MEWIDSQDLATLFGIDQRNARRGCQRITSGKANSWNGCRLVVRTLHGKGGRSGIQYAVRVSSLPDDAQDRLKALQASGEAVSKLRLGDEAQLERNWKYDVIHAAAAAPKGSSERKAEIDRLHHTSRTDWRGERRLLTKTTLYKWIEIYETDGIHALSQQVRSDKGEKKVLISRAWSNAVPFTDEVKAQIEHDLKQYVRSLIKGGSQFKQTCVLVGSKLRDMTVAYGFAVNDEGRADKIFAIPQAFVQDEAHYSAVYRHRSDRKASEDDKPRIRRTIDGVAPMEIVVADIHHINVQLLREDGSMATPKLIAFYDVATHRFFYEVIFFENGGGVRNVDVIRAFLNMCNDPAFGIPQYLYFDNGSEYRWADYLEDALKLGMKFKPFDRTNNVIRAKAYNASAKRIEGGFRELNQQVFRHIPGWIDDDRMKPKGAKLGKVHPPFAHGFDAFCGLLTALMNAYDHMPQKGALRDRSPAMTLAAFIAEGWRATLLEGDSVLTVFTKPITRKVKKHGIEADGRPWTCDGLDSYFGRSVVVHMPVLGIGFNELLIEDPSGRRIGIAVPGQKFAYLDPRGAQESARRTKTRNAALAKLAKSVPEIDVAAELIAFGEKQMPVVPNEPIGVISVDRSNGSRAILPTSVRPNSRQQADDELRQRNQELLRLSEMARQAGEAK